METQKMTSVEATKSKWEITIDAMMIIGKYFETNDDYINVMKVCKKYHDLVRMYHFNPISECELFENMETQHFYHKPKNDNPSFMSRLFGWFLYSNDYDSKKPGMHQYVYWYHPDKELEENEVIKDILFNKYIVNNIPKLEEWSGKKYSSVLYDSDIDGKDSSIFRNKILNHNQLCFIAIDSNDNVFGHYHPGVIDKIGVNFDKNIFIFTLNSNGRSGIKKFNRKDVNPYTCIYNNNDYYSCYCYYICQIDTNESFIGNVIADYFEGIEETTLTGNCRPDKFTTKRVIIIEMK